MGIKAFFNSLRIKKIAGDTLDNANDAESLEEAKRVIIKALKEHPEMKKEILSEIGNQIDGDNEIPNALMDEVAMGITTTKEIPNKIINSEGVKNALTDDGIQTIIKKGNIDPNLQNNLADSISDKNKRQEVKKEITNNTLSKLYNDCGKISDAELITKLKDLQLDYNNMHTKSRITNIIARQMAFNYLKFKSIIFPKFREILSVEKMFELNLPGIIEEEIKYIKEDTEGMKGFTEEWRKKLLEDVCDNITRTYIDTGIWNIPNSEEMRNINEEEEQFLLSTIETKLKNIARLELTVKDKIDIQSQIRGKSNVNSIINTMAKYGLLRLLINMPEKEAEKIIKVVTTFVMNRSKKKEKEKKGHVEDSIKE